MWLMGSSTTEDKCCVDHQFWGYVCWITCYTDINPESNREEVSFKEHKIGPSCTKFSSISPRQSLVTALTKQCCSQGIWSRKKENQEPGQICSSCWSDRNPCSTSTLNVCISDDSWPATCQALEVFVTSSDNKCLHFLKTVILNQDIITLRRRQG